MQSKSSWPSDIWSVGATAVELAEGGPPYCEFPATRAMTEISVNGFLGFRNVDYFSEAFTDFVFTCMDKDPQRRPPARQLLDHPFIKQTEALDRVEIFEDLPETTIDFAKLLEIAEEEEEAAEGGGGGEAEAASLPKPVERRTLSYAASENVRRKVGYATFRPPAPADATPQGVYRRPEPRAADSAPLSVIPPGGRQPTSLPVAAPPSIVTLGDALPAPPPTEAQPVGGEVRPTEKIPPGTNEEGPVIAAHFQICGVPLHIWILVGAATGLIKFTGWKKWIILLSALILLGRLFLSGRRKEKQE